MPSGSLDLDDDLLTPRVDAGDVAPKGFFDDLPQPARQQPTADEVAPKGFFDDLPQPARQQPSAGDVAPKGFFDDLPQPATSQGAGMVAPKGFFDDLPQPAISRPGANRPAPAPRAPSAGGSLFDDIPLPGGNSGAALELDGDLGFGEPAPGPAVARSTSDAFSLDLGLASPTAAPPRVPSAASGPTPPAASLDLGDAFGDLELPKPSVGPGIRFDAAAPAEPKLKSTPSAPSTPSSPQSRARGEPQAEISLELDDSQAGPRSRAPAERAERAAPAAKPAARKLPVKLVAAAALGLVTLGGGGFFLYSRHAASQERQDQVAQLLAKARRALSTPGPGDHWQAAVGAARQLLELDDRNVEALGISAEAQFASAIDLGIDGPGKIGRGQQQLAAALASGQISAAVDRAQALKGVVTRQPDSAIKTLTGLIAKTPTDGLLKLYLGWAYHAKGADDDALKAYDDALKIAPGLKVSILYARGQAKLARADLGGARADFGAVLEVVKDHVGAQVGLAAATPATQATQREADLLAILHRPDLDKVDPRAVVAAWVLVGDEARRGGRLDTARDRYREALKKAPNDGLAASGLAEVELRDNKIDAAAELITKALTVTPDELHAHLVAAEIEARQKKYAEAEKRLAALDARQPPLGPLDAARVKLIRGEVAEAQQKLDLALTAYSEAAGLAGEVDLTPTMAAVKLLAKLAEQATAAKDVDRANQLRDRAGLLLGKLAERAETDPALALTLGVAYLQAGDPAKAEEWVRKATVARPSDVEGHYQLAKALNKLGRVDDAIAALRQATKLDPSRSDVGLDLARMYEAGNRDAEAEALYASLLKNPTIGVELRGRAGRYYARRGKLAEAGAQGDEILKAEPTGNAVGFYLRGEGLLAANKPDDARKAFQQAVDIDPDPTYYDGQGRAAEALALAGETKAQDSALIAYKAALDGLEAAKAPPMFNPLAGRGRIYLARGEAEKALTALLAANKVKAADADVLYGIGLAYHKLSQPQVAIEWLNRSIQTKPTAEAAYLLGTVHYDLNDAGPAAAALTTATRLAAEVERTTSKQVPWLTDALYLLGRIENDLHDEAAARHAWELFLGRNPTKQTQVNEVKYQLSTNLRAP